MSDTATGPLAAYLRQMISETIEIGLVPFIGLALAVVPSFIVMGLTGFGPAIVFHVAWHYLSVAFPRLAGGVAGRAQGLPGDNAVVDAVMLLAVNAPFSVVPLYRRCRADVNWDYFWWLFLPITGFFCVGTEVLVHAAPDTLRLVLGYAFLSFAAWLLLRELNQLGLGHFLRHWLPQSPSVANSLLHSVARLLDVVCPTTATSTSCDEAPTGHEPLTGWRWRALAMGSGALSGALNGMFGTPGPPLLIFFALAPNCTPSIVRATSTACHFWNLPIRLLYFFGYKKRFNPSKLPHMLVVVVFSQVGLRIGNRLHDHLREKYPHTLKWSMLALLVAACALMAALPTATEALLLIGLTLGVVAMHHHEPDLRHWLHTHSYSSTSVVDRGATDSGEDEPSNHCNLP
eukprot:TRINITY_DN68709_c0_g1_i1.p1 TRINITY_DN68709_c0_g1~~TRINITY_DN68709_c0_g1_i1.p1  ORF type:complete len:402 (+),score=47.54 TRINITY_DN68709_c0_g1_i1:57-1262(+)